MRKAAVRHGDPTTTRGFVIAVTSTIFDNRKQVALSGDEATCGNCKGAWKIYGTGKGMSEKGRDVVVDGDLVLCPCKKNKVLVGSNPGIFLQSSTGSESTSNSCTTASTGSNSRLFTVFDERVCAASTCSLDGYPYCIEMADGRIEFGRLDASGRLPRIETGLIAADFTVYWGEEALSKQTRV
jgi:uncharacterized Zn-binding protein involved in type VI secretion